MTRRPLRPGIHGRFPLLPVEEDGRLHAARTREHFIEWTFVLGRWRRADEAKTRGALARFHIPSS
ncbi:MAG: hypothetical protein R6V58_04390 [Planctomycetota bacterium]